jgi:flagellar basal body-associated protein FliL
MKDLKNTFSKSSDYDHLKAVLAAGEMEGSTIKPENSLEDTDPSETDVEQKEATKNSATIILVSLAILVLLLILGISYYIFFVQGSSVEETPAVVETPVIREIPETTESTESTESSESSIAESVFQEFLTTEEEIEFIEDSLEIENSLDL